MNSPRRRLRPLSDEEEAAIQRQIAADPDDGDAADLDLADAKPFAAAFPALMESIERARGRPKSQSPKVPISIRLDPDVIAKFRATGPGWQSRINEVLKAAKV